MTQGLGAKGILSYDYSTYRNKNWSVSPYIYQLVGDGEYELKDRSSASLSTSQGDRKALEYQLQLTYDRTFGPHSVSGLFMAMAHRETYSELFGSRNSFDSEILNQLNAGNTNGQSLSGYDYRTARISYVGRINYNYMQRYLAEVNIRHDGSENFAPDKRWGTFASYSLGWVISEEAFFENLKEKINFLKIRGSYGTLGNDNTGGVSFPYYSRFDLYSVSDYMSSGFGYNIGDYLFGEYVTKGLAPGAIANRLATWEKATKSNIALDLGLFNTFNMSVDLFLENRSSILAQRSAEVPGSFGGTLPLENIGKVRNKGIDLMASYSSRVDKVTFMVGGNFTFARNKIIEMAEAAGTSEQMRKTGRPIGGIYGYKTDGIFKTQAEIDAYAKQEIAGTDYVTQPGDIKYVDVNNDGVVNADDMTYLGIGNIPEIVYGINGSVSWNQFDLSFLFQGAARTQVYLNGGVIIPYFNQGNLPQLYVDGSWSENNVNAIYPRLVNNTHNFPTTDVSGVGTYVYDASYFRLKI
ncbi:MAG: SusC/RagA family TonB-linked outer membrane protein [Tannerellaceae bacterium]|nr:SusC/RagA family TonB-linked outer membrane protein [Tannerellaceae bacterium]